MRGVELSRRYDIAIAGSGFGGSLTAMILRRMGLSVVLLERNRHPRFAIGESSTPLTNLILERLCRQYDLERLTPLCKWGSWQATYPHLACGLKRGFSFFHHSLGSPAHDPADRERHLLVAASPHDRIGDTHWYRGSFDHFLAQEAVSLGADLYEDFALSTLQLTDSGVAIGGNCNGEQRNVEAGFIIDATGPRGFLHQALQLEEMAPVGMPSTQALYSHFRGVERLPLAGDALPYPVEDAAVHHVFEGGWIWVLHFNNGITSAGVAASAAIAERLKLSDGEAAWKRMLNELLGVKAQFTSASPVERFVHMPRVGFRSSRMVGSRWAMLPSAAGFVDPLLSTGFPLTLLGIERLTGIIRQEWGTSHFDEALHNYAAETGEEFTAASQLIGALYRSMGNLRLFAAISFLYFAAVSYAETACRMQNPSLSSSFLLHADADFATACKRLFEELHHAVNVADEERLIGEAMKLIEPINLGGFGDSQRQNWYPVDAEDLLQNAHKLHASEPEVAAMLERSGFWET